MKNKKVFSALIIFFVLIRASVSISVEIADVPMISSMKKPPAHLMFIIDNSGSMNWETMMEGEAEGLFKSGFIKYGYIFENGYPKITGLSKRYIKPKLAAFNKIYYNPKSDYIPWPETIHYSSHSADLRYPKLIQFDDNSGSFSDIFNGSDSIDLFGSYLSIANGKFNIVGDDGNENIVKSGTWKKEEYFTAYKSEFHITSESGSTLEIPLDLPSDGTYSITAYWPMLPGDSSGEAEFEVVGYLSGEQLSSGVIVKNQSGNAGGRFGADAGLGNRNGRIGDVTVKSSNMNSSGPDIKIIVRKPENSETDYYVKADRVDAVYQYGASSDFGGLNDFVANISNAHYFTWNDQNENSSYDEGESVYLVSFILDESGEVIEWTDNKGEKGQGRVKREYFLVNETEGALKKEFFIDDGAVLGDGELVPVPDLPHHAKRFKYSDESGEPVYLTAKEDLQNFANWFEFYRTRLLAAKSAMARTVYDLSDAVVGLYTINKSLSEPGLGVKTYMPSTYIVDDDDMDEGAYYEETGGGNSWKDSFASISYNSSSRSVNGSADYSDYKAVWKISDIEDSGEYKVYVRWTKYTGFGSSFWGERDPAAKYRVYKYKPDAVESKILVKEVTLDQNGGSLNDLGDEMLPDIWNYLCDVKLADQEKILVELQRGTGSLSQYTSADAVKAVSKDSSSNTDNTNELLDLIYRFEAGGGTPLRFALRDVGQYFSTEENPPEISELGNDSPYKKEGGECLQAFAVLMTDGFWNGKNFSIGDYDNDNISDTLADVAAKYYQDLDKLTKGKLTTSSCDSNMEQHLVTYAVAFGASGSINPSDYDQCNLADQTSGAPEWPKGDKDSWTSEKIDDLFHASVNSHGAFYNASDPQKLFEALTSIIKDIEIRYNTGSAVSVNSHKFQSGLRMYQSCYNTGSWSGWVEAREIEKNEEGKWTISDDSLWTTNDFFIKGKFIPGERKILIKDPYGDAVNFNYLELSETLKSSFDPMVKSTLIDEKNKAEENVKKIVSFIRGEDQPGFRERNSVLGDIVHSSPVKWGETVYAGANDGMLHALEEATGKERFAFIPSFAAENLGYLADPLYKHRYFVDHTPVIQRLSKGKKNLRITEDILVSGLRKGGKGYFALNLKNEKINADEITMLSSENLTDLFKWEFPTNSEPDKLHSKDMGYSFSRPVIVKSNLELHPFIVLFGNGYNSENGKSVLFILDAFTGECIRKIPAGKQGDNGMSTPAVVDHDSNFTGDYVYAGDLKGNLWKFDISSSNADEWGCFYKDSAGNSVPLFTAGYGDLVQPVTTKPDIARHCSYHGYMILFGTGRFLSKDDMDDKSVQSVYAVWDYGDQKDEYLGRIVRPEGGNGKTEISNISGVYLLDQSVEYKDSDSNVESESEYQEVQAHSAKPAVWKLADTVSSGEQYPDIDSGSHAGWYFDLPDCGERVVEDVKVVSGKAVFISYVPEAADQMCTSGGYSWFHELDVCDGSRPCYPVFDINSDSEIKFNNEETLNDILKVETDGEYKYVAPSRIKIEGMGFAPAIVTSEGEEAKILSTSEGKINMISEKRQRLGIYYWRLR